MPERWEVKSVWVGASSEDVVIHDGWEPFGVTSGRLWLRRRVESPAPPERTGYRRGEHVALVDNIRLEGGSYLRYGQRAVVSVDETEDGYVGIDWRDEDGSHAMAISASVLSRLTVDAPR